jgi:prepilin-type N-terminal cleavage/methylation domain-containing protein
MKSLVKSLKVGQKGFTLIELLVVITILGVLAAVAIPQLVQFMNRGQTEAAKTELSIVQTAVTAYSAEHNGIYPDSVDDLSDYIVGGSGNLGWEYTWNDTTHTFDQGARKTTST